MKAQLLDIIMYSETKYCIVQYIPLMGMVTQLKSCTTHSSVNLGSVLCDLLVSHYRIDTQHTVFLVAKPNGQTGPTLWPAQVDLRTTSYSPAIVKKEETKI